MHESYENFVCISLAGKHQICINGCQTTCFIMYSRAGQLIPNILTTKSHFAKPLILLLMHLLQSTKKQKHETGNLCFLVKIIASIWTATTAKLTSMVYLRPFFKCRALLTQEFRLRLFTFICKIQYFGSGPKCIQTLCAKFQGTEDCFYKP